MTAGALGRPRTLLWLAAAFLAVVVGGVADVLLDAPETWLSPHVLVEVALIGLSLGLSLFLLRGWHRTSRSLADARQAVGARQQERDAWRRRARKLLEGLGREIQRQLEAWELTPAEREVALLLIKGYSHQQIADMTDRSERTARQHATAVYRKAGVSGRAELAGFFLEDLMLPEASPTGEEK